MNSNVKQQCRHIFTDGRRCGSPCLRLESFCYYHHTTRKPIADPAARRSRRALTLPLPEDRSAIQHSIGEVLQRIAANKLDPRRAGLLLYGLQIAAMNLPKPDPKARLIDPVNDVTLDPVHGLIALPQEHGFDTTSPVMRRLESLISETYRRRSEPIQVETTPEESTPKDAPQDSHEPIPFHLPFLNATAAVEGPSQPRKSPPILCAKNRGRGEGVLPASRPALLPLPAIR
jgi:hypothetical protein